MFCETKDLNREKLKALGLSFNPFKAIVAPRPIGLVTTISSSGVVNLAPYSFFNAVSTDPPMVFYGANGTHDADGGEKDSLRNVRETGEFVCNLVTWDLRHAMNDTSAPAPRGVNEMQAAGIEHIPSRLVKPPRVAASPAHLECKLHQFLELPVDPRTGKRPHAVVQLRQEDARAGSYNLVGFQNHMRFGEQQRVLRMVPGLANAEFLRYGQVHRNTYINAPALLMPTLQIDRKSTRLNSSHT